MKQKLTFLMLALLTCAGAWADTTITIAQNPSTNGDFSSDASIVGYSTTWTAKGDVALVLTTSGNLAMSQQYSSSGGYGYMLGLKTTTGNTNEALTISAPANYYIKSYSLTARLYSSSNDAYTITNTAGTATAFSGSAAAQTISESNICTNRIILNIKDTKAQSSNYFCVTAFTVTLASTTMSGSFSLDINSTTGDKYRDGESTPSTLANDFRTYQSTSSPAGLKLVTGNGNSMNFQSTTGMKFHTNGATYTLTAPSGYYIKGYKMSAYVSANKKNTIKPEEATAKILLSEDSSAPTIICVDNIYKASTTFVRAYETGGGADYAITTMTVYLEPVVTYTIVDGAATVSGGSAIQTVGSAPNISNTIGANSGSSYNNPYCKYSYFSDASCETPIASITGPCTVYAKITGTSSVPVEFASAVDDGGAQWYTLKLRDYSFYVDGGDVTLNSSDITSANAQWVFTGTVCNANVYNKALEKYLIMSEGALAMSDTPEPWILAPHQSGAGFYLYYASDYKFPFRNASGNLAYSQGPFYETANAASFVATEVAADYSEDIVANVKPFFTTGVGSIFGLKSEVQSYYGDRVTDAETSCDADEYSALLAVVSNPSNFVYPASGYYRIKNYSTEYYLGRKSSDPTIEFGGNDAASVLYLTRSGAEGSYTYAINMQGTDYEGPADQATGDYTLTIVAPGRFAMNDFSSNTIFGYTYANGTAIATESLATGGDAAYWTMEAATSSTITLNSDGASPTPTYYATLYLPFDATISGADPFTLAKSGSYLVPTAVMDNEVPAGTPVLLKGSSATATATINTGAAFNSGSPLACDLTGTYTDMSVTKTDGVSNDYFLGIDSGTVGFYKWNGSTLKANRAYFEASKLSSPVKGFVLMFDEDADAIKTLSDSSLKGEGAIFNLAGQRVSRMQKGINIVNGKKVLF